jgi:RNA polymerase sigma factor (sigma-70 family)
MQDATVSELSPEEAIDLVVRTIQENADSLLRVARRHSLCADDAQDAYQRALEIFMRRASTVRPETAAAWLRAVVKHEAMAVRASRLQIVGAEDVDMDAHEAGHLPSPEEQLLSFDMVTRSAEALQRLKPQEVRALWLKAAGHSYEQIAETTGWTYTKVLRSQRAKSSPTCRSNPTTSSSGNLPASVASVTRNTKRPTNRPSGWIDSQAPCSTSRRARLSSFALRACAMRP